MKVLGHLYFVNSDGKRWYKYLVIGGVKPSFVINHSDSSKKYSEDDICRMLGFLIDDIIVMFGGRVFQQIIGIPIGPTMHPFSPNYSFIRMKLISYRACCREKRKSWLNLFVSRSAK